MMLSVNRETMLTDNQHNQFAVTKKKEKRANLTSSYWRFFFLLSVGGGVSKCLTLTSSAVSFAQSLFLPLSLILSVCPFLCHNPFLSLLYDLGYLVS